MIYNETNYNAHWATRKLASLGEFSRGKSKHRPRNDKKLFEGGGYPLIQTSEVRNANLYINEHTTEYNSFGSQFHCIVKLRQTTDLAHQPPQGGL